MISAVSFGSVQRRRIMANSGFEIKAVSQRMQC
jgi:hypothetical protein